VNAMCTAFNCWTANLNDEVSAAAPAATKSSRFCPDWGTAPQPRYPGVSCCTGRRWTTAKRTLVGPGSTRCSHWRQNKFIRHTLARDTEMIERRVCPSYNQSAGTSIVPNESRSIRFVAIALSRRRRSQVQAGPGRSRQVEVICDCSKIRLVFHEAEWKETGSSGPVQRSRRGVITACQPPLPQVGRTPELQSMARLRRP